MRTLVFHQPAGEVTDVKSIIGFVPFQRWQNDAHSAFAVALTPELTGAGPTTRDMGTGRRPGVQWNDRVRHHGLSLPVTVCFTNPQNFVGWLRTVLANHIHTKMRDHHTARRLHGSPLGAEWQFRRALVAPPARQRRSLSLDIMPLD